MLKAKQVHFIGIGGIGISAIAKMLLSRGVNVSGSDAKESVVIDELKKEGAQVYLGHDAHNISSECELVIYTNALAVDNVELVEAKQRGLRLMTYPQALGEFTKGKFTIAISGNAGKTTTTALIGQILIDAGLDPTIIVGSLVNFTGRDGSVMKTNFVSGKGQYFIVEADEYKRAFLNLEPKILAINNIEEDHLDYYKDLSDIQSAFIELVEKVPEDGFIVCSAKDANVSSVLNFAKATIFNYPDTSISEYHNSLPGEHNRDNTKVAVTIASIVGIQKDVIAKSLADFKGVLRRFEYKGRIKSGALLYDDYAHNPRKIRAVIAGTREKFPDKKMIVIFQPHLFSRTKQMLGELSESFSDADRVIITPIYAARENFDPSVSHHSLKEAIVNLEIDKQVELADTLDAIPAMLESEGEGSICLTIGAGDIHTVSSKMLLV